MLQVADSLSFSLFHLLFFSFLFSGCAAFGWWRAGWLCVLGRSQDVRWVWCDDARGWMLDAGCLDACVRGWWIPKCGLLTLFLSLSLSLSLAFLFFLFSWVCGVWMVARWVVVCVGTIAVRTLGVL